MKKNKKDFFPILTKIVESYKNHHKEIINHKEYKKIQKEFTEGLDFLGKVIKEKKELVNEIQDKIFKMILLSLSMYYSLNFIENSLESFEIIFSDYYFDDDIINNNMINLTQTILELYGHYKNNMKVISQGINLIKVIVDNHSVELKNESLYNVVLFLTSIILYININNTNNRVSEVQTKKISQIILNKCIEKIIAQNNSNNNKNVNENSNNEDNLKFFTRYQLNNNLYENFLNQIMKYMVDNCIEEVVLNDNKIAYNNKNEKGIDKGKYKWCFNCRNEANYFSEYLNLPICSKRCENIIAYTEKLLSFNNIYYHENNVLDDYINTIKLITYNGFYYLKQFLFINNDDPKDFIALENYLSFLTEIVIKLLSQEIILKDKENKYIIKLIKEYVFPFLIEEAYFNKTTYNLDGIKNNMKLFELLIHRLDGWYIKQLKNEIYIFTDKIIVPYFNKNNYIDDFINNNTNRILKYMNIKSYLIDLFSSDLKYFLFELYNNYNNDFYYDNIFMTILENITNAIYDCYEEKEFNELDEYRESRFKLRNSCFYFISKILEQLNDFLKEKTDKNNKNDKENNDNIENIEEKNEYLNLKNILNEAIDTFIIKHSSSTINFFTKKEILPEIKDFINYKDIFIKNNINLRTNEIIKCLIPNKVKRFKYNYKYFPKLFKSQKEIKSIFDDFFSQNFDLSLNYDDFTASILAFFIKFKFEKIMNTNKLAISNFFSSFSPFNIKVLYYYINNLNLKNYSILEALHYVFNFLPFVNSIPVIDKVINIFVTKFISDNFIIEDENMNIIVTEYFTKLCNMIKEISISILEDNDVQKQINNKKLKTINEYITSLNKDFKYYKSHEKLEIMNYSYVYDMYNQALTNPINFYAYPNKTSLIDSDIIIKSNNNLYGIFPTNLYELYLMNKLNDESKYLTKDDMNIDDLKNIISCSWSFFFGIFSKFVSYYSSVDYISPGIEKILIIGRICETLNMYIISDAFFNSIINLTGLNDFSNEKINAKNIVVLKMLINYIENNGQYIYSCWYPILNILSHINIYKRCTGHLVIGLNKNRNLNLSGFLQNFVNNTNQLSAITIDSIDKIYLKTKEFNFEVLKRFIAELIKVSEEEIQLFNTEKNKKNKERFFSFDKLVCVIDINKERLKKEERTEIYTLVNDFFVKLISNNPLDDILLNKVKENFKIIDKDIKE